MSKIIVAGNVSREFKAKMQDDLEKRVPLMQCDVCGEMKADCRTIHVSYAGETTACAKCRGDEE